MPAEIKIIERAEMYLRKLSCGVNPLTEESLPETDACRQERISKCLVYVADYLKQKVMPDMERQEKLNAPKPGCLATIDVEHDVVHVGLVSDVELNVEGEFGLAKEVVGARLAVVLLQVEYHGLILLVIFVEVGHGDTQRADAALV